MQMLRAFAAMRIGHILFAFVGMGGWAVWANRMHDMPAPLIAGVVQGMISATLTIVLQAIIGFTLARTHSRVIAIIAAGLVSLTTLFVIHTLARTPEVLTTIALPWCIGLTYAVLYTLGTAKERQP